MFFLLRLLHLYSCLAIIQSLYDKLILQKFHSRHHDLVGPLRMSQSLQILIYYQIVNIYFFKQLSVFRLGMYHELLICIILAFYDRTGVVVVTRQLFY
jgi:hypothetical protein